MKQIEIFFRKVFLQIILFLNKRLNSNHKISLNSGSKVLLIRLNRIGDALVTTPFIKLIKEKTGCSIDILADRNNHFIFSNNPSIRNIFVFRKGLNGLKEIIKIIKLNNYDAVIDLHDDISTTVTLILAFSKAKSICGLQKGNENVYTHTVKRLDPKSVHIVDRILELSNLFNFNKNDFKSELQVFPSYESNIFVKNYIKEKYPSNKFLIGINISAGSDARFWGIERFKMLIKFLQIYDVNILLLTTPMHMEKAKEISENRINIFPTKFDEMRYLISELDFLFTPDTALVHIASVYKTPLFGIYVNYNTTDMIWSPYNSDYEAVITEEPNFENLDYSIVEEKFIPYFKKKYESWHQIN